MKMMKKIATLVLAICLIVPCFSFLTHAANGEIRFNDPSAKVGETVDVVGTVKRTDGTGYGKVEITMTYDTAFLKFKGGDNFKENTPGTIVYSGDATSESGPTHEFKMQFNVLKAGTTKLVITEAIVKSVQGATLDYTKGNSTIKISAGEGGVAVDTPAEPSGNVAVSGAGTVEVDGVSYKIANEFPQNEIPQGYEASILDYDMATYNVVYNENNGLYLAYLVGADNVGNFFMYVEEDATFAPFEQVEISDNTTIIVLSDVSEIVLPEEYAEIVLTLNNREFPAWNNTNDNDYYVLYAMNQDGEASLYQYDSIEGTYQRFTAPEVATDEGANKGFLAMLTNLLENHLDYVILGTGLGFILFILIIVILGVKLYNRNAELDEIYDEYGIDTDEYDTKDDVILDLDEDEEDDYDDEDDDEDDDMTYLVREGMREVFPEDDSEDVEELHVETVASPELEVIQVAKEEVKAPMQESLDELVNKASEETTQEDTLAQVLAKQKEADKEAKDEYLDEEEDFLENFSMDFIDLDD